MVKKRNMKSKLIGNSKILNELDRKKRIDLIRASIISGNDHKNMRNELYELTNQQVNINNKKPQDLIDDLNSLTPILKTSNADINTKNRVL